MVDKRIEIYAKFLECREAVSPVPELAAYDWLTLKKSLDFGWLAYVEFINEHHLELANSINELRNYLVSLRGWNEAIKILNEQERLDCVLENVVPLATLALLLPYVIRSRFLYSVAHLSHQANQLKRDDWKDDLPLDSEIYMRDADLHAGHWKSYGKLKQKLQKVANREFSDNTHDFRNSFNHRYSPRIEFGLSGLVKRRVDETGNVSYELGQTEPLKLELIIDLLQGQLSACHGAFTAYQKLVNEQSAMINNS